MLVFSFIEGQIISDIHQYYLDIIILVFDVIVKGLQEALIPLR